MANDAMEQILLDLGLDLSPFEGAADKVKGFLQAINNLSDQVQAKTDAVSSDQKRSLTDMKSMADAAVQAATLAVAQEKEKAAVLKTQTAEYEKQQAQTAALGEATRSQLASEDLKLRTLQLETAEIQKQILERKNENAEKGRGGLGAQAATKIGGALFGSGVGGLIGAVTGGELIAHGMEQAVEGVARLIEKLKEASIESGKLSQIMDRFNKLAAGAGIDGPKFLDQLSQATEGLVDKVTLAQFGLRALQSGIKGLTPDKIKEVTEAVVKLAESSGHTASQGVEALGRALYRGGARAGAMLAQVTGLTRTQLQLANLSPILNRTQRDVESLNHTFAVLISEAAKLGEVPRTLDQASTQLHVVAKDLLASFGQGFNESGGTQVFLEFFASFTRNMESLADKARAIGDRLGQAFTLAIPALTIIKQALIALFDEIGKVVAIFGKMGGSLDKDAIVGGIRAIGNALIFVKPIVDGLVASFGFMAKSALAMMEVSVPGLGAATGFRGVKQLPSAFNEFAGAATTSGSQQKQLYADFNAAMDKVGLNKHTAGSPLRPGATDDSNPKQQAAELAADKTYQEAMLRQRRAYDALELEDKRTALAEAKRLDDESYATGEETLEQHLQNQKKIAAQEYAAQLDALNKDLAAKKEELANRSSDIGDQVKLGRVFPSAAREQQAAVSVDLETAINDAAKKGEAAWAKYEAAVTQINKKGDSDRFAAEKKATTDALALIEENVKSTDALNKQFYEQGKISADDYVKAQADGISRVLDARKQASASILADARANGKQESALVQEQNDANVKSTQEALEKLRALQEQMTQLRLQDIQKQYEPQNKALTTQIGLQQQQPGVAFSTSSVSLVQALQKNLQTEMQRLVALANTPEAQANPDTWFKIYEQIQNITAEQLKWNDQLRDMTDILKQAGQGFGAISQGILATFHSKTAQNLGETIGAGAKSLDQAGKLADVLSGKGVSPDQKIQATAAQLSKVTDASKPLASQFDTLSTALTNLIAKIQNIVNPASGAPTGPQSPLPGVPIGPAQPQGSGSSGSQTFGNFVTKMGAAITAVTNFTESILKAHTALSGAAGGALGGAGLAKAASGITGLSALGGPIGQIGGALVGALLGGIVGQKNAEVKSNLTDFEDQYKQLMNQFALNTNNLNDTIVALQALVNNIRGMQSSSKKGSAQYQQLIDQYDDQIQQMEQQQNQIIINMNEMAAVASAPLGQQQALGGIQSILQQYEQYAGAIQTVSQLMAQGQTQQQAQANVTMQQATAYQYLTAAIANYETNLETQLNQDEQQAINTALQLNDLLYQRQQMMLQYNDQVEAVLSAGVLTRQLTRAQSAGQQIEQMTVQYNMQMDQINEQISADQYSVSVATQIFGLATTRIGLENQLLAAQNAQTTLSMAQIAQLQALVTQIQSGNFGSGALGALLGAIPTVTNNGTTLTPLEILLGLLTGAYGNGTGGGGVTGGGNPTGGTAALDALFAGAYQSRASMGYGSFRATNL